MATANTTNLWGDASASASTGPKLKVALVGCGGISSVHCDGWRRVSHLAEVVATVDPIAERRAQRGKEMNVPESQQFASLADCIKAGVKLDAIDICASNAAHAPETILALDNGLHVLCEKPLAMSPQQVRDMIAARDRAKNKILMTAQHMRFQTNSSKLHDYIKDGLLGDVYYARAQFLRRRFLPGRIGFIDKNISGGGPCIDIGVHILDLALHMMGHPEPVTVSGIAPQKLAKRNDVRGWWGEWDRDKITVEDFAAGAVRFANGAMLTLEVSWLANIREPEFVKLTLVGTDAGAEWPSNEIFSERAGSTSDIKLQYSDDGVGGHQKEVAAFVDAIIHNKPSPVPAEQSLNVIRILDGLYRSHEAGAEVTV
jgi:predicted dehydrogenase